MSWWSGDCQSKKPCQQLCFDLHDGTFECACRDNFFLSDNGYTCIAMDGGIDGPPVSHPFARDADHHRNEHNHHDSHREQPHHQRHNNDHEEEHFFDSTQIDSDDEDVDLEQFSSSNSRVVQMTRQQELLRLKQQDHQKQHNQQPQQQQSSPTEEDLRNSNNLLQDESGKPPPTSDALSFKKKEHDKEDVVRKGSQQPEFKSCLEIECEAGGTCVSETTNLDSSSASLLSSFRMHHHHDSQVHPTHESPSSQVLASSTDPSFNIDSMVSDKTSSSTRVRCRCPLGRKGFFCEKREYLSVSYILYLTVFMMTWGNAAFSGENHQFLCWLRLWAYTTWLLSGLCVSRVFHVRSCILSLHDDTRE